MTDQSWHWQEKDAKILVAEVDAAELERSQQLKLKHRLTFDLWLQEKRKTSQAQHDRDRLSHQELLNKTKSSQESNQAAFLEWLKKKRMTKHKPPSTTSPHKSPRSNTTHSSEDAFKAWIAKKNRDKKRSTLASSSLHSQSQSSTMQEAKRKANYATWVARKKAEAKQLNREAQQKKQREEEKRKREHELKWKKKDIGLVMAYSHMAA